AEPRSRPSPEASGRPPGTADPGRCWQSHHEPPRHSPWRWSRHDAQIMPPLSPMDAGARFTGNDHDPDDVARRRSGYEPHDAPGAQNTPARGTDGGGGRNATRGADH